MEYKVCILAAGVGTRMSPLTNKINKSLLPVNFKAVISHIIEKFDPNVEIVIAVGHLKNTIYDYLECAYKNRNFTFVEVDNYSGEGSGPGYSLMQCKKHLDKPFIFFASDTLVTEEIPLPSTNWLGVSEVNNTIDYCTADIKENKILKLDDKTDNENKFAFIGLAGVNDYKIFFKALEKNNALKAGEYQVSNGFSALIDHDLYSKFFSWLDTGNMKGYLHANNVISNSDSKFDFSKRDEFLYFLDNRVIKYFTDENISKNRCIRASKLEGLCPEIDSKRNSFYSYKMLDGQVIYDVIDKNIMKSLLGWLDKNLWKDLDTNIDYKKFKESCSRFYYDKTLSRLSTYFKKYLIEDSESRINGLLIPPLQSMLDSIDWEDINNGIPSNFHGDLQFDNILLRENGSFSLLDWRQDFSGEIEFGDRYYDFAKLNGGMEVSYKLIKKDYFSYKLSANSIEISHDIPKELIEAQRIYFEFLNAKEIDISKVHILTSLIYLNMSPMHNEPFDHFIFNLGKLKLYKSLSNF